MPFSLKIPPHSAGSDADGSAEDSADDSTVLDAFDDTTADDLRTEEEEVVGGGVDVVVGVSLVEVVLGGSGFLVVDVVLGESGFLVVEVLGLSSPDPSTLKTTMLAVDPLGTVTTQN